MNSINFDNVYMLFIAIPLVVLLTVPFFVAVRKDNRNGHNVASAVLHIVMAVLIAFAAAGTKIVRIITETDVYVVADVSYSADKNLDTIDNYVSTLKDNLPSNSKIGLVCFGKDYKEVSPMGKSVSSVKNSGVDDSETNIAEALEYTGGLFKEGVIKRIVLITDGKQTYSDDAANLKSTVDNLRAQDITVDAIYLNDNISEGAKEVQISGAEFTKSAYLNHEESVNLVIQSSYQVQASVTLYKNGEQYSRKYVGLTLGVNNLSFTLDTSASGENGYRAVVEADGDECEYNNSYSFIQTVSGVVSVLMVTADPEDEAAARNLYGSEAEITVYNVNENRNVPVSVEELCKFDEIMISDVDLTEINNYSKFLDSVNTVVSSFGKSLVTLGDMRIQNKTEGELKKLDDMLPVRYGESIDNPKLFTIVLDVSRSMSMWSRMILAKQAAVQLVNSLKDSDYICVVEFAGDVKVVQAPAVLSGCRSDVIGEIENINYEQGTIVGLGLNRALNEMRRNTDNYSEMQVMLITDGLTYEYPDGDGVNYDSAAAVETMRAYGIYTSVISVGGGSDTSWLANLAVMGGGEHYHAETEQDLSRILFADIQKDLNDSIVTDNSWIKKNKPRDEVVADVNLEGTYVSGFVVSKSKSSATNVLTVDYKVKNVTLEVPLYSYWRYGNGKVSSYTSKLSEIRNNSGTAQASNESFFKSVFSTNIPKEKVSSPYTVTTKITGKKARIEVRPELKTGASALIFVTRPDGETITDNFTFNSSEYFYEFVLPETGKYKVGIVYSYGGNDYAADASFNLSYSPEYDAFAVYEASVLYKMLSGGGTVSEDGNLKIVNDESKVETYVIRLTVPLLAICAVLFIVDIVIRKLKWNDITSLFGKIKRKGGKSK